MGWVGLGLALLAGYASCSIASAHWNDDRAARWERIALAVGVGLGATSVVAFAAMLIARELGVAARCMDVVFAAAISSGAWLVRGRRGRAAANSDEMACPSPRATAWLAAALAATALLSLARFAVIWAENPSGRNDGIAIWNLRATFLARAGPEWREAFVFTPSMPHTDYPLLVPLSIARAWGYAGEQSALVPTAVALGFAIATVILLCASVTRLRGLGPGLLAGIFLLADHHFVRNATALIADVPIGFYYLAVLTLLARPATGRGAAALAGVLAGFAAWTKNEGLLFLVVLAPAVCFVYRERGTATRCLLPLAAGALPVLGVLALFKFTIAPANDLVAGQGILATAERVTDVSRHLLIAREMAKELVASPVPILAAYAALVGFDREAWRARTLWLPLVVAGLMALGFFAVYVVTPNDLAWHLRTSLERLFGQLWPSVVLGSLLLARDPFAIDLGRARARIAGTGGSGRLRARRGPERVTGPAR